MVELTVRDGVLEARILGLHKLWALKSRIRVPLSKVRAVRHDPGATLPWTALRMPGTYVPGAITAGTYRLGRRKEFWDVVRRDRVVVIELEDAGYDRLVVEVADPIAAVRTIEAARRAQGPSGDDASGRP